MTMVQSERDELIWTLIEPKSIHIPVHFFTKIEITSEMSTQIMRIKSN